MGKHRSWAAKGSGKCSSKQESNGSFRILLSCKLHPQAVNARPPGSCCYKTRPGPSRPPCRSAAPVPEPWPLSRLAHRRPDPPGKPRGPLGSATLRLTDQGLWIFFPSSAAPCRSPGAVRFGRRRGVGSRPVARLSGESRKPRARRPGLFVLGGSRGPVEPARVWMEDRMLAVCSSSSSSRDVTVICSSSFMCLYEHGCTCDG